jgi:hypothetical protein
MADLQAEHEPAGIGLGQYGRRAVHGLRLPGHDPRNDAVAWLENG